MIRGIKNVSVSCTDKKKTKCRESVCKIVADAVQQYKMTVAFLNSKKNPIENTIFTVHFISQCSYSFGKKKKKAIFTFNLAKP